MDGLGISFDAHGNQQGALPPYLRRTLAHSISLDQGLNQRYRQEPMVRQPSEESHAASHRRVRIADGSPEQLGGKNEHLHLHHPNHHLSPLSDFDNSSASDTGSSQPFSPASLSDLPSSTESGAYPTFYRQQPPPRVDQVSHEPSAPSMESSRSRPYPPSISSDHSASSPSSRPSRLPAFLQDRQRGLARPKSMLELGQAYARPLGAVRGPRGVAETEHVEYAVPRSEYDDSASEAQVQLYPHDSPVESVPSSAGGLQRRNLERQLQEQKELLEAERRRLRQSEGRPRERPSREDVEAPASRQLHHQRSRSLSAQEMRQLAEAEERRAPQQLRRSQSQGVLFAAAAAQEQDDDDEASTVISLDTRPVNDGTPSSLQRQSTLLTSGASTVRRRKELSRLLAPTSKKGSVGLPSITGSPTPSASSAATALTRLNAASQASTTAASLLPSPVQLEQSKVSTKARIELDLVLETPMVVEGGMLKGKLELRVRKPKDKEGEVWIGRPKIRVIGFEELDNNDARFIFFHHAQTLDSIPSQNAAPLTLPCFDTQPDQEGYCRAKLGQHVVPVRMTLPVGKGAKGPWKGKQGVVRYIAIASVKLKSKTGSDRSIAHFYRHVDVFPYYNPAIILAPALKPLQAEAAKSLFMGGSGKVSLKASMHRETWVAGQRCYVDVRVENESGKRIKTLTISLHRTTTVHRPASVEGGTTHTQSTRKKVAETTLEMGKKGTKGVTAKGSWMGVDAGESADFSHSLLVPSDALSISRGRHIEVSYAVKVAVGGSLSADVAADIPVRIIDFVSLDPPPGHVGASPILEQQAQPLARSWSTEQLRSQASSLHAREGPLMNRMVSIDSLRLEDLNSGRGPSRVGTAPALSRIESLSSVRTNDHSRAQPVEEYANEQSSRPEELHPNSARSSALVDRALSRQLHHQMSLNCISSAIASATARRQSSGSLHSAPSSADVQQSWEHQEKDGAREAEERYYGGEGEVDYSHEVFGAEGMGIQLDDLNHVPDDPNYLDRRPSSTPGLPYDNNEDIYVESDDELDTLMQSHFSDDDDGQLDDEEDFPTRSAPAAVPTSPTKVFTRPRSSSLGRASSPVKAPVTREALRPSSPAKRSPEKPFAFATPSSPIKAMHLESQGEMFPPPARSARPLPTPPAAAVSVPLSKQPSTSSLRRNPCIMRKTPSTRSLRSVASSAELSSRTSTSISARVPLTASRSPSLASPSPASPKMSPVLATVRTRSAMSPTTMVVPSSPRRVVKTPSPALRATRSMADLHGSPNTSAATRRSSVLPSVKSKVAALETRQSALTRLATTSGRARVSSVQLARADSMMSAASSNATEVSEASFNLDGLSRANSFASFKAPLLKRTYADAPPLPSLLSHQ